MILELGGGLGGSFIAFVIPGSLWIKSNKIAGKTWYLIGLGSNLTRNEMILYSSIIAFGFALLISTIGLQIEEGLAPNSVRKDCQFV
jgi:hypothetical protein